MKKLGSFLTSCVLILSMTACQSSGPSLPPADAYEAARAKTAALTCGEYRADMDIQMESGGISFTMGMDMDIKSDWTDRQNPKFSMDYSMEILGQSLEIQLVCVDQMCYLSSMGEKGKFPLSQANSADAGLSGNPCLNIEIPDSVAVTAKTENGYTVYSFTLTDSQLELDDSFFGAMLEGMGSQGDLTVGTVSCEISVNSNGYIEREKITMPCTMEVQGVTATFTMTIDGTVVNPGTAVSITAPEDAASYPETEGTDLGSLFSAL